MVFILIQHESTTRVAGLLNQTRRAIACRQGQPGKLWKPRRWDRKGVLRILQNPLYAGYVALGEERPHLAQHDPIVSKAQYDEVQRRFTIELQPLGAAE